MNTDDYIKNVETACIEISKCANEGHTSYPYAFGYFASQLQHTLRELNLNKKQLKVLESRFNQLNGAQEIHYELES